MLAPHTKYHSPLAKSHNRKKNLIKSAFSSASNGQAERKCRATTGSDFALCTHMICRFTNVYNVTKLCTCRQTGHIAASWAFFSCTRSTWTLRMFLPLKHFPHLSP